MPFLKKKNKNKNNAAFLFKQFSYDKTKNSPSIIQGKFIHTESKRFYGQLMFIITKAIKFSGFYNQERYQRIVCRGNQLIPKYKTKKVAKMGGQSFLKIREDKPKMWEVNFLWVN